MARYDRIARLDPPSRDHAFGAWPVFQDLEGRERDPERGRRAIVRFLILRPVRRLVDRGFEGVSQQSLEQQIELAHRKLESLPAKDAERMALTEYLEALPRRSPADLARATLEMGAVLESAGERYAAEEFYHTALELAEAHHLRELRIRALRARCALELKDHRAEAALESGWRALELTSLTDAGRQGLLRDLGAVCRQIGLHSAAESCDRMAALAAARTSRLDPPQNETEELLSRMEGKDSAELRARPSSASPDSHSIAQQIEALEKELVASG